VRFALLSALLLVVSQTLGAPVSRAMTPPLGHSAADAVPIASDGRFAGIVWPSSSTWYHFQYAGGRQKTNISVTYLPLNSSETDLAVYTGTPDNLVQENAATSRYYWVLYRTFQSRDPSDVFIRVMNGHSDRVISFVGEIAPSGLLQEPAAATLPMPGAVADTPNVAIGAGSNGTFLGALAPHQVIWHRFYYDKPGTPVMVAAQFAPTTGNARLDLSTGPDVGHLSQQADAPALMTPLVMARRVTLPSPQWVYFTVTNRSADQPMAYSGLVMPPGTPPAVAATGVAATGAAPNVVSDPVSVLPPAPQPAPALIHDERYFSDTGFRIDDDSIWGYFQAHGRVDTLGLPVSRTFELLGCPVQIFQRQVVQICQGQPPSLLNLLDPEIFPYTHVGGTTLPPVDETLKAAAPSVSDPDYATKMLTFVAANVPDIAFGRTVNFAQTFISLISPEAAGTQDPNLLGLLDLEVWGAPISQPQVDPSNADFVYQRFQRGVMHNSASRGVTRGLLLADYLKAILRDLSLPADLREDAQTSRFFAQYCPGAPGWLCRPVDLEASDLTFAFEPG
jgi:hypothetical protein